MATLSGEQNSTSGPSVIVGLSGGVDSATSALLLQAQGYQVIGATLNLLGSRASALATEGARQICERLNIPFVELDRKQLFDRAVIEPFCNDYLAALTPNPCIKCNRFVKFAALHEYRREHHIDYVATGHYARIERSEKSGRYLLKCAVDASKDQSYVLFNLSQEELAHTLFPLGTLTKSEVRTMAHDAGFHNADAPESQDICFIPGNDYASFIEGRTNTAFEPGPIITRDGKVVGQHTGLARYTIGQRKGIGVAWSEPLYVFEKDPVRNALVVGTNTETLCERIRVEDANFIAMPALEVPARYTVKTLYRQKAQPALVAPLSDSSFEIVFERPQRAAAPGQSAVVYDGDTVICGGTIVR